MRVVSTLYLVVVLCFKFINGTTLRYVMAEEMPAGTHIGDVIEDTRFNMRYHPQVIQQFRFGLLQSGNQSGSPPGAPLLAVREDTGEIVTATVIDRERICPDSESCTIHVDVAVSPPDYFQVVGIEVEIKDINDHAPVFPQRMVAKNIPESASVGNTFWIPAAEDRDSTQKHRHHTYQLLPAEQDHFDLRVSLLLDLSFDLQLVLKKPLDKETMDRYQLTVEVREDEGEPNQMDVNIYVEDVNDNKPLFESSTYTADLPEDSEKGETVIKVTAHDADTNANANILYTLNARTLKNHGSIFGIEHLSGVIYLRKKLDYERDSVYTLIVHASDQGQESMTSSATVIVNVIDVNDSPPRISISTLTDTKRVDISEDVGLHTFVAHISVNDDDAPENGKVVCILDSDTFSLERLSKANQYKIITAKQLDYETQDRYEITITCHDSGVPPLKTQVSQTIYVRDANDHLPLFTETIYPAFLNENNVVGISILTVHADDVDQGLNGEVVYFITDKRALQRVDVDEVTGEITAKVRFDYEKESSLIFAVLAVDKGIPARTSSAAVTLRIQDVNDCPPVFKQDAYEFRVYVDVPVNTLVGIIAAEDDDYYPYDQIQYFLSYPSNINCCPFKVDKITGEIRTTAMFRRGEVYHVYPLEATAENQDDTSVRDTVPTTIYVYNHTKEALVIYFPPHNNSRVIVDKDSPIDSVVTYVRARSVRPTATLRYILTRNKWFSVNERTGTILVAGDLSDTSTDNITLTVSVEERESMGASASAQLHILIVQPKVAQVGQQHTEDTSGRTLVMSVVMASIVIMLVLITAIAVLCYKYHKSKAW